MLSKEELRYLFEKRNRSCVSIFLPTRRAGLVSEMEEGRIQLKDLLHDAETRLTAAGLRKTETRELLAPARQLAERSQFWRHQSEGLALFLAHGFLRYFQVPRKFQVLAVVDDRFDITPLLPLWSSEDRFYLLALSLKHVRVFEGTRYAIAELDVTGLPKSLQEVLGYGVDQSLRQQHSLKPGLPEDELLYFRQINEAFRDPLKNQHVPLVLAGVEDALSLYRQANTYAGLLDDGIVGNPDRLSADELHAKALKYVRTYYDRAKNQAIVQYRERANASKTCKELHHVLPAAYQGRVYHLFVPTDVQKWGKFNPEQNELAVHENRQIGDHNLMNLAVVQTILNGGSVYVLDSSEMPDGSSIAALLRY
jgi:release factor family 3